jgi:hypothetical protein
MYSVLIGWYIQCTVFWLDDIYNVQCSDWMIYTMYSVLIKWYIQCTVFWLDDIYNVQCSDWMIYTMYSVLIGWYIQCTVFWLDDSGLVLKKYCDCNARGLDQLWKKFKQRWSTISPIFKKKKVISHFKPLNT